jgi:hypothetical protein
MKFFKKHMPMNTNVKKKESHPKKFPRVEFSKGERFRQLLFDKGKP